MSTIVQPLCHHLAWDAKGTSIADARHAVHSLLVRAGHPPHHVISQDAQLVVSELVTNALRHAPGPGELLLEVVPSNLLRVTVRDGSPRPPEPLAPDPGRPGGHGVHVVTRLSERMYAIPADGGKQVVAELRLPS